MTETSLEKAPYKIVLVKDDKDKPSLRVETARLILDSARLIEPKAFTEGSKPTYFVRALMPINLPKVKEFYNVFINYEKQLFKSSSIIHAKSATEKTKKNAILVPSSLRLGSELLEEYKDHDETFADAIKAKEKKRKYYENMSYLNDYAQMYVSTGAEYKPSIKDRHGKLIEELTPDMFEPAFYGRLLMKVKLTKSDKDEFFLKAYLSSVIYLGVADPKHCHITKFSEGFTTETSEDDGMLDTPQVSHDEINDYIGGLNN